jgi:hypothetical protein
VVVYINEKLHGWAYMVPHPTSPWISLPTLGQLFGHNVYWVPLQGSEIRLIYGDRSMVTADFILVGGRMWIKAAPPVQAALGVKVAAYDETGIHFSVQQ